FARRTAACRWPRPRRSRWPSYRLCLILTKVAGNLVGMAKKCEKLSDQVRRAVDASGLSRYAVCKALGLSQATMSPFMSRQGGLSMEYLDALAELLDLKITAGRKPDKKGK